MPTIASVSSRRVDDVIAGQLGLDGMKVWWLFNKRTSPGAELTEAHWVTFPPKLCHGLHRHPEMEEVYVVMTGRGLHLTMDGPIEVTPGDVIHVPANEWHGIDNGDEETTVLVMCARMGGMTHYGDGGYEEHPKLYHGGDHPNRPGIVGDIAS